jgi:S1-C subfamily serine protease
VLVAREPILGASGTLADTVATQDLAAVPVGSPLAEYGAAIQLPAFRKYAWQAVLVDARGQLVSAGPGRVVTITAPPPPPPAAPPPGSPLPATTSPVSSAPGPERRDGPAAGGFSGKIADVVRQARPSVVRVTAIGASRVSVGSGFVVAPRLIGTNAHVVAGAQRIRVATADGPGVLATVIAQDANQDLALLRLPRPINRPALRFAPSVRVESEIVALGYPYGAGFRAAPGRVRDELTSKKAGSKSLRNLIETSAPLFPGSSGGPVLDLAGRVVGVVVAGQLGVTGGSGSTPEGTSFAVSTLSAAPAFRRWMSGA